MTAYSEFISAVRAAGGLTKEKLETIGVVQKFFNITKERHQAELRRVAYDDRLGAIADT